MKVILRAKQVQNGNNNSRN